MFIGREEELGKLERLSKLNKPALVVCRGRRRIGKSTLIQQFGRGYPHFCEFQGLAPREGIANADQLANFSGQMAEQFGLPILTLKDWQEAFSLLANQMEGKKMVVLFDEISWMASYDKDFVGQLKIAWDTKFKRNDKLILVLCGSVSSWIDENILNSADFMGRVSLTISLDELPLALCNEFWGKKKDRISGYEKFKLLSITGGVPRYLEEIDVSETAENNIKVMCFDKSGILFSEFDKIFNDIFSKKAGLYKQLINILVDGDRSFSEVCERLLVDPNGVISKYLCDLETSGFIARDFVYSLKGAKKGKLSKYRLRDNYLRFYLKYIEPERDKVEKGLYRYGSVENFPGFEAIMGFQLENLVLNNLNSIIPKLKIPPESLISASPYFQNKTGRQQVCQIDLLIQTKNTIYVCEVKFRKKVESSVISEVQDKIKKLKYPKTMSVRPVLIYVGELAPSIESENFFDKIISLDDLLR